MMTSYSTKSIAPSIKTQPGSLSENGFRAFTSFRLSVMVPVYNERHVVEASLRRVLALEDPVISSLELIVVDDRSTDGTWEVLQRLAADDSRIVLLRNERNLGKGAAIRKAIKHSTGDISIIHDADLEYDPADIPSLLIPFAEEGADAVFGSRYLSAPYRRALMHRHTTINKALTTASNWLTDLSLTDLETCYKAIKTDLLKSIPIRSNDFRFEVEITFKLAKRGARVFEAPIRYMPRTREEGKKIRAKDGILAIMSMLHYWFVDDLYAEDEYGSTILSGLKHARRLNLWIGKTLRPYIGDRVLELGAGIGTLTGQFIPRETYVAADSNPHCLSYLQTFSLGKPYLHAMEIDPTQKADFQDLENKFDTVLAVNVMDRVRNVDVLLENINSALLPGGRALVFVSQNEGLFGELDKALGRRQRYNIDMLKSALEANGLSIETFVDFNRFCVPAWWLNSKILRRRRIDRLQLKIADVLMPIAQRIDCLLPWRGLSILIIAVKH